MFRCVCFCVSVNACGTNHATFFFFLNKCSPHHYTPIFMEYCGNNSNAFVFDHCRGMTTPQVVFCAHSSFPKTFMPLLNSNSVQCSISTNLSQQSMNDCDCIAMQSFDLDVWTLFRLCNMSWEIFCFVFEQLWHCKILKKQPWKLPHSLRKTVQTTHCWPTKPNSNPTFPGISTVHYFWDNPRSRVTDNISWLTIQESTSHNNHPQG